MSMTYSVIGRQHNSRINLPPSLDLLREAHIEMGKMLALMPDPDEGYDAALPAAFAYNLDHLYGLLEGLHRAVPDIADVWLCGYAWGTDKRAWTTWSGHEDRRTAERWLQAWQASALRSDNWEIRRGDCRLGKFMPKGTRTAPIMARVGQ